MSTEPILQAREGGVTRLTLNRPERLNSFTAEMHAAFRSALDAVETDEGCRCLVITGAGRSFCAGQDLKERLVPLGAKPVDIGEELDRNLNPLVSRLNALPVPVIAAVNGIAAGAGASLALAADLIFAARSAKLIFSFTKIGLCPDGGSSWKLPRLVGAARAAGLALLGEPLPAEQAEAWGLIWRCVDDDALAQTVGDYAQSLATRSRAALAETKHALQTSWRNDLTEQLVLERNAQQRLGLGADYREGVAAFLEKRPPRFGGASKEI